MLILMTNEHITSPVHLIYKVTPVTSTYTYK